MPRTCPSVGLSHRVNCLLAKLPSPSFSAFAAPILHVSSQMQIVFGAPGWPWSCSLSGLAALRREMLGSCAWIINFLSDRAWGPVGVENCQASSLAPTVSPRSSCQQQSGRIGQSPVQKPPSAPRLLSGAADPTPQSEMTVSLLGHVAMVTLSLGGFWGLWHPFLLDQGRPHLRIPLLSFHLTLKRHFSF